MFTYFFKFSYINTPPSVERCKNVIRWGKWVACVVRWCFRPKNFSLWRCNKCQFIHKKLCSIYFITEIDKMTTYQFWGVNNSLWISVTADDAKVWKITNSGNQSNLWKEPSTSFYSIIWASMHPVNIPFSILIRIIAAKWCLGCPREKHDSKRDSV